MSSRVEICNLALLRIGHRTIESPEEKSAEAVYCKQFYDVCRRIVLRAHPWNFSVKIATLAGSVEPPQFGYQFRFQLPNDCLYPIEIANGLHFYDSGEVYMPSNRNGSYAFKVMGREILSNVETTVLAYTMDIRDTTFFTDSFSEAVSFRLAADLSMVLTKNVNIQKNMMDLYTASLAAAQGIDAREHRKSQTNTILSVRG